MSYPWYLYANTLPYWQDFMSIVNEVDNTLNTYFNEDTSPDVMRWLANVVYNDNQKLQALSPVNVNPDVLDLASQYVECYLALSKFLNSEITL